MKATAKITIDLTRRQRFGPWVSAVQGDVNTRCVEVTLLSDGRPWCPPAGVEAAVHYRQSGGTKGMYNLLADGTTAVHLRGSTAAIILAPQMLTQPGNVQAAIVFCTQELDQLTSFPFTVTVEANPLADTPEAQDYIRLQWLEDKLDECLKKAKDSGVFDGPKGDPFTYDDFTPEQLTALIGPQGPAGDNTAALEAAQAANTAADAANTVAAAAQAVVDTVVPDITQMKKDLAGKSNVSDLNDFVPKYQGSDNAGGLLSVDDNGFVSVTGKMGLIETIDLSGLSRIDRDMEPDGTQYAFRDLVIWCKLGAGSPAPNVFINNSVITYFPTNPSSDRYAVSRLFVWNGSIISLNVSNVSGFNLQGNCVSTPMGLCIAGDKIRSLMVTVSGGTATVFASGSFLKIYGVRC